MEKLSEATSLFFEKIAFYSAGIISLSITFLGYVLSKSGIVLFDKALGIPLYYWIFTAWGFLFIALILSLYIRVFSAQYLSRQMHEKWIHFNIEDSKKTLHTIEIGEGFVNELSKEELPKWIEEGYKSVSGYEGIATKSKRMVKIYTLFNSLIRKIGIVFFLFGFVLALFFVANVMLKIAKV